MAAAVAAGLGGIIFARAMGPTVRGEYAAVTAWFGVSLLVGGMGQPAALCFHVARYPDSASDCVATSRAMMLATGSLALIAGMLIAPILAHGNSDVTTAYRIAFGSLILAFTAASYTFALQARDLRRWNVVRVSQPVLSLAAVVVLWRLGLLSLDASMLILVVTMLLQLGWSYRCCRLTGLAPGRARTALVRPLAVYGAAQIAATTPAAVNAQLDQLVLSQTVSAADLGRYAVAVSLTMVPIPLVSAIGNVAFPKLASRRVMANTADRIQRLAVLGSIGLSACMLLPLAIVAYWMIPLVFGAAYRAAVPLLWILTPGAMFLACGQVVGDLLRGRNRPVLVAWAQGLAAVLTVSLLLILVPFIGVYGAAIASTLAYGVALAAMLRSLHRVGQEAREARDGKIADGVGIES
jgi:O-antigen/teichoic acid export membrane protein